MYRLAQTISIIFSPLTAVPLFFFLAANHFVPDVQSRQMVLVVLFGTTFLPTVAALIVLKLTGRISDWEITNRKERRTLSLIILICILVAIYPIKQMSMPELAQFLTFLFFSGVIFSGITLFWKISAHTSWVSIIAMLLWLWYGVTFLWVWLIVALVAWSRVSLRRHSVAQVMGGILFSVGLLWIGRKMGWV